MTLAELQAYVGVPPVNAEVYFARRGGLDVHGWRDTLVGERGWWYAVTRGCGDHEIVLSLGWTAGNHLDRDAAIACALTIETSIAGGVVS